MAATFTDFISASSGSYNLYSVKSDSGSTGVKFVLDQRTAYWQPSFQTANQGRFLNFSFTADGFSVGIAGSLQMIPEVAKITSIITGILGILGLFTGNSANEPLPLPKVITADPGITLGSLLGATNGLQTLINVLKGTIDAWKGAIQRAITSIKNLFKCLLKNPLLALSILARIFRQLGVTLPPEMIAAMQVIREALNKIFSFTIDIALPLDVLDFIKRLLSFKIPPFLLLPFIPDIPGCSPAFYTGRPPVSTSYGTILSPQIDIGTGITSSRISTNITTQYSILTEVGQGPTLATTKNLVVLSGYSPTDSNFYKLQTVNGNLQTTNLDNFLSPANSQIRQVQDNLISSGNNFSNTVSSMEKDVSRIGIVPRTSPLDDLLCAPNQLVNR
jgi:hypothetical protein